MTNCSVWKLNHSISSNCSDEEHSTENVTIQILHNETNDDGDQLQLLQEKMNLIQMFVCPTLLLIGSLGNSFVILTVSHEQFRQMTSRFILCALAFSDTLLLFTNPFHQQFMQTVWKRDIRAETLIGCKIVFIAYRLAKTTASWCVVLIAIERFVAVIFPLKAKVILTRKKILISLGVIYTIVLIIHSVWTFSTNIVNGICRPGYVTDETKQLHKAFTVLGSALYSLVPMAILFTLTPPIVITLIRRHGIQRTLSQGTNDRTSHDTSRVSIMLIMVVVSYIVWVTPITLVLIMSVWTNKPIFGSQNREMIILQSVALTFEQLNHSCNFITYILFSTQFRRRFLQMIKCRGRSERTSTVSSSLPSLDSQLDSRSRDNILKSKYMTT